MSSSFQKKSSSFFVTAFIGLIIVSFMFTGYETMRGAPDSVATVGGKSVSMREYQNEYNRQMEFYQNFFGGGTLTSQQIREFGIANNTVNSLINGKLMLLFAEEAGARPSAYEVKEEIKSIPAFLTNDRFDIERYKALLTANGLTPADFEADVKEQIKAQSAQIYFQSFPVSQKYLQDVLSFRAERVSADLIRIQKESLRNALEVTQQEIEQFLGEEFNANRVQSMFSERKAALDQAEEVKARHILISTQERTDEEARTKIEELAKNVTARNFIRLANENTDDPSGKNNGGDLGWFEANGAMVPEFEQAAFALQKGQVSKPVKTDFGYHLIYVEDRKAAKEALFEEHRDQLAREIIQRNKVEELDELVAKVQVQVANHLRNNNQKGLTALQDRYGFQRESDVVINRFDGAVGTINLKAEQTKEIFEKHQEQDYFEFQDENAITFAKTKTLPPASQEELMASMEQEKTNLQMLLARKLQEELIESMRERVSIRVNTSLVR